MIFLYILLGIFLILGLISIIPVGVDARYRTKLYCVAKIGFLRFRIVPQKRKKKKPKSPEAKPKREKPKKEKNDGVSIKKLFEQNGVSGIINIIKKIGSLAVGALKDVFSHVIIRELMVDITVSGENAADTALDFGYACTAVYPAVSAISQVCICKDFKVMVTPDFTEGAKSKAVCRFSGDIRIFWLIKAAVVHGFKALQLMLKLKKAKAPQENSPDENNIQNGHKSVTDDK